MAEEQMCVCTCKSQISGKVLAHLVKLLILFNGSEMGQLVSKLKSKNAKGVCRGLS